MERINLQKELKELVDKLELSLNNLTDVKIEKIDLVEKKKELELLAEEMVLANKDLRNERERKLFKNKFLQTETDYELIEKSIKELTKREIELENKVSILKYKINVYKTLLTLKEDE